MAIEIKKVKKDDYEDLYFLLKQAKFPYLPDDCNIAFEEFSKKDNCIFIGLSNGKIVLFLCFAERDSKLYFDIACLNGYRKKWANKAVLKFIFRTAFKTLKYKEFYVESFTKIAQKAVKTIGFKHEIGFFYKLEDNSDVVQRYLKQKDVN